MSPAKKALPVSPAKKALPETPPKEGVMTPILEECSLASISRAADPLRLAHDVVIAIAAANYGAPVTAWPDYLYLQRHLVACCLRLLLPPRLPSVSGWHDVSSVA